jgi:hypothetical protein
METNNYSLENVFDYHHKLIYHQLAYKFLNSNKEIFYIPSYIFNHLRNSISDDILEKIPDKTDTSFHHPWEALSFATSMNFSILLEYDICLGNIGQEVFLAGLYLFLQKE